MESTTNQPECDVPSRTQRITAWILLVVFLAALCGPGGYQFYFDEHFLKRSEFNDLLWTKPTADSLKKFESDLTDQSRFDQWVRHTWWKSQTGGVKPPGPILIGSDDFLFPDFDMAIFNNYSLTAPAPSPAATILPAIADFQTQLNRRGIQLLLLPVPSKLTIYPEKLAIDYRASDGPAYPPGYTDWVARVRAAGFDMIELTPALWQAKSTSADPVYWPADVHWSYRGRSIAADMVADHIRPLLAGLPPAVFDTIPADIDLEGDMAKRLALGYGNVKFPRLRFHCLTVMRKGQPLIAGDEAPILLIGDSYTQFYNDEGFGFADELMQRLQAEVQTIGVPGEPINYPRRLLSQKPSMLTGKRLVIWEFAVHSIWSTWDQVPLR